MRAGQRDLVEDGLVAAHEAPVVVVDGAVGHLERLAHVEHLAVVVGVGVVAVAEPVAGERGPESGAQDELGACGQLVECTLDLRANGVGCAGWERVSSGLAGCGLALVRARARRHTSAHPAATRRSEPIISRSRRRWPAPMQIGLVAGETLGGRTRPACWCCGGWQAAGANELRQSARNMTPQPRGVARRAQAPGLPTRLPD